MKAAVAQNFKERIIHQHGIVRKTASDGAVVTGSDHIEEVAKLRNDLQEIAVHGEDVASGGRCVTVAQSSSDATRRFALHHFHSRLVDRNLTRYLARPVSAVVVHDDDFVDV